MIISASRRTDIPAYYLDWFVRRLDAGYVLTRNPFNPHQISRVDLSPQVVDGIVLWTKNPLPMLSSLEHLREYAYYVQHTLTPYDSDIEPALPSKWDELIPALQRLSLKIGPERVIWRYDPILLSEKYTVAFHLEHFARMSAALQGYTKRCVFSFLDIYRKIERQTRAAQLTTPTEEEQHFFAREFASIAKAHDLALFTCAERIDLSAYGIQHATCIDGHLMEQITGRPLRWRKDSHQRPECGCASSVDIGVYNTCPGGCRYCYANYSTPVVTEQINNHNPYGELLIGQLGSDDTVKERR